MFLGRLTEDYEYSRQFNKADNETNWGPREDHLRAALNGLCGYIAHLAHSPDTVISQRDISRKAISIMGAFGRLHSAMDLSYSLPGLDAATSPMLLVPDLRSDPRFVGHPILVTRPYERSLIAVLVPGFPDEARVVIRVLNPRKSAFADAGFLHSLTVLGHVVRDVLRYHEIADAAARQTLFAGAGFGETHDPAGAGLAATGPPPVVSSCAHEDAPGQFLEDTLIKQRKLLSRNGVDYSTLRSWRSSIKKYQISALAALKKSKPGWFVDCVADEIARAVIQSHGESVISTVVPVPGGSSGDRESLSVMVGRRVAERLGATCMELLKPQGIPGKSTPKKSAMLAPYEAAGDPRGPVLVVDDVASSGRHLELAVKALRTQTRAVYAMAWIGQ